MCRQVHCRDEGASCGCTEVLVYFPTHFFSSIKKRQVKVRVDLNVTRNKFMVNNHLHVEFFQNFLSFCWWSVALNIPSYSTDTRLALKHECHSKPTVQLKVCSAKASQSISRVSGSRFTELHVKHYADTLILPSTTTNHEVKKAFV
jgi:hypothetical protein